MNRQILQASASEWVRQAMNDIRNKMIEFMQEVNTSRSELAYALAISEDEIAQILDGNPRQTVLYKVLETFAKLLIATGNVLEIKPVEESPLAVENGAPVPPVGGAPMPPMGGAPVPPVGGAPMPHGRQFRPFPGQRPNMFNDFHRQEVPQPAPVGAQPRGADGRFRPWPRNPQQPNPGHFAGQQPPFSSMQREQLVDIIQTKLWDTEIDVENASREQLVRFLEDKDRRMNEIRNARNGQAIDPSVVQLKDKIKQTLEKNPHLRNYLKDIFQEGQ